MAKYKWIASSNDGWEDEAKKEFATKKEAYEDMRKAVFEKMCWNTEFDEDLSDGCSVPYEVKFQQDKIVHKSFSGTYTYEIVPVKEIKTYKVKINYVERYSCEVAVEATSEQEALDKVGDEWDAIDYNSPLFEEILDGLDECDSDFEMKGTISKKAAKDLYKVK
jgi:hypothetical protein